MKNDVEQLMSSLRTDHRNMALLLDLLDVERERLAASGVPDYGLVQDIMRYMTEFPDVVHHPTEDFIYRHLKSLRPDIDDDLERVERDHENIENLGLKLKNDIEAMSVGANLNRDEVIKELRQYIRQLREHMYWEEKGLFTLADELQGRDDGLVFPAYGLGTQLLSDDDDILNKGREGPAILEIPLDQFVPYGGARKKAKGPHQITHGDIARACGYCPSIGLYQRPSDRWRKTYEDRAFRWLIDTHGVPVDVPGACQIRHIAKGRYAKDSLITRIRQKIRKGQDD